MDKLKLERLDNAWLAHLSLAVFWRIIAVRRAHTGGEDQYLTHHTRGISEFRPSYQIGVYRLVRVRRPAGASSHPQASTPKSIPVSPKILDNRRVAQIPRKVGSIRTSLFEPGV